jgi:hypothetical protein
LQPVEANKEVLPMPKFVIEREIPGAGRLTRDQLRAISQTSCGVLSKLGSEIQWIESYVTADKVYCVYRAPRRCLDPATRRPGWIPGESYLSHRNGHRSHNRRANR